MNSIVKHDDEKLINKIKCVFYDILIDHLNKKNFQGIVQRLLSDFKQLLSVNAIHLYIYNKQRNSFILKYSTEETLLNDIHFMAADAGNQLGKVESNVYLSKLTLEDERIVLLKYCSEKEITAEEEKLLLIISEESKKFFNSCEGLIQAIDETIRYEQLYRVTAKFHSTMDIHQVLDEIISTLKNVYPAYDYFLLLSDDYKDNQELPIADLEFAENPNSPAAQAYLTGEIRFTDDHNKAVMFAPLKGKQGVYGVLQVTAKHALLFPEREIKFIGLLANTAGSALENAKLYQQSRQLISDLQLINKASHRLNSNLRLSETINFMSEQIMTSFQASEVAFVIFLSGNHYDLLEGSTEFFYTSLGKQFLEALNRRMANQEEALFVGDMSTDSQLNKGYYRSLMAVPMMQSDVLKGAVYVMHEEAYYFTFENFKLLQSLIHHSALAFANSILKEELEKIVITDHLTQLYSRNYLDEQIQQSMQVDDSGAFILIDIDDFKQINDTYGHQVGDEVIIQVANIIKENIREVDIGARWGGEELAVYLPRVSLDVGIKVAERLVKKVSEVTKPNITISCGISYWEKEIGDTVKKLFNRADEALYTAKRNGKNQVVIYGKDEKI